ILLAFSLITLVACNNIEVPTDDDINYDLLKDLDYYQYLNKENPVVSIKIKDLGEIKAQLFPSLAQNTVNNFITYIQDQSYDNSTFHRVIKNFMIQGGMVKNTRKAIPGEFARNGFANPLKHTRGVLSMARTAISYNSQTSQFFIMHVDYPYLDYDYASFGGMISGFDVLDQIANTPTNASDAPLTTIVIESITVNLRGYEVGEVIYV